MENESYVKLKRRTVQKMDSVLQESSKLCREFQRKQVNLREGESAEQLRRALTLSSSSCPVVQALRIHVGAEEEAAGVAGAREHPRHARPQSGAGGQRDDWVRHTALLFTRKPASSKG